MMLSRRRARTIVLLACGLLALGILPGHAIETASLNLGTLEGEGWSAQAVTLEVELLDAAHVRLQLQAQAVMLPADHGRLGGLRLECAMAQLTPEWLACTDGSLSLQSGVLGRQQLPVTFRYRFSDGRIDASLSNVRILGGRLALTASYAATGWQLHLTGNDLSLQQASAQLAAAGYAVPQLEGSGRAGLTARLDGTGAALQRAELQLKLQVESFTNADGSLAGEDLDVVVDGRLKPVVQGWYLDLDVSANRGGLYAEPLFIAVPSSPLQVQAQLLWDTRQRRVELQHFDYRHPGSVRLQGSGQFSPAAADPLRSLQLKVVEGVFPALYETYLQPWLTDTALGYLETAGQLSGQLRVHDGALSELQFALQDVSLLDQEQRFGLARATGQVNWSGNGKAQRSELAWESGSLYRVALGPARIAVESSERSVQLLETAQIPVLDGTMQIDAFDLEYGSDTALHWQVDGLLTPISMTELSRALGWPEFAGKLSGVIPSVRYQDGDLEVGGILLVRVFDGEVTLRNVRLEQPLGVVPRLQLDARANNIDLELLTRAFSFGRIEGRLEGRIDGLEMESWRPVAFDAAFATPGDDRSRHRISQKAVDNISSIGGGGVGGAVSRSFLRFLKDFPYDRLGIRCRLENGICAMGGVAPAANGYYLVKGRFLPPRLDVVGYADRVDWDSLIAQILAVTGQQDVVVE
jgi:hypothetical protein